MVVAPVVLMHAVDAGRGGERIGVLEATRRGVPWVPRYVWTNVHTTVLFWVPVGTLVLLWERSPLGDWLPTVFWVVVDRPGRAPSARPHGSRAVPGRPRRAGRHARGDDLVAARRAPLLAAARNVRPGQPARGAAAGRWRT